MQVRDLIAYLLLAITWGHSFLLLLHVVGAFGWGAAVTLRALIAGLTLAAYALVARKTFDFRENWRHMLVVGATAIAGLLVGMSYATPRIGTAMAAIFVAAIPLFSVCIGRLWRIEKITPPKFAGLVIGLFGMVLLVGFPTVKITDDFLIGCAASIAGSISSAYGGNYASLHLSRVGSVQVTYGAFIAGGIITLPLLWVVPVPVMPQAIDVVYLLLSACVMSAGTYIVYFELIKRIGATRAISVEFIVTLIAVVIGAVFLGEKLNGIQVLGGCVILLGCTLVLGLIRPQSFKVFRLIRGTNTVVCRGRVK